MESTVLLASVPNQMSPMNVTLVGTNVRFAWTPLSLANQNGSPVTAYKISILNRGTMLFTENTAVCDGSNSAVISNSYCDVSMASVISTISVTIGEDIEAVVQAINSIGYSTQSLVDQTLIAASAPPAYPSGFSGIASTTSVLLSFS